MTELIVSVQNIHSYMKRFTIEIRFDPVTYLKTNILYYIGTLESYYTAKVAIFLIFLIFL